MDWTTILATLLASHALLLLGGLMMLLLLASILRQRRNPAASAAWLVFIISVPYVGIPLYLFFGTRKLAALSASKAGPLLVPPQSSPNTHTGLQQLLDTLNVPPPLPASDVHFHRDADESRTALYEMLESARASIDISMFILGRDKIGREILEILCRRAAAGVNVRLLLDGVGSFYLFRWHLYPLIKAGGQVAWFIPVLHIPLRGRTNLRNHRKLVIVDNTRAWTGGRNLADDYLQSESASHWIDLSFDLLGTSIAGYVALFNADWAFATRKQLSSPTLASADFSDSNHHLMQLLPAGPDVQSDVLHDVLARLFMEADTSIALVTPYFVPSEILQSLLCIAARSGIRVDIVLPKKSNHRLADYARQRFLRELHRAGANIYCLADVMLHAKAIIIDDKYAMAGSANFDLRSLFLNFEMMTLFYDQGDVKTLIDWTEQQQSRAVEWIPKPPGRVRETLEGLVLLSAFQL